MSTSPQSEANPPVIVLLIDDQPIVGHAVKEMLKPEPDIQFHFCKDPLQAIPMANELRPTIILQDLVMPEVDGLTLLKFFRANAATRQTPIVVLSSKEEATTKAQAFALGASDYLVKLPDRIELIARIRHHSRGYVAQLQRDEAYLKLAESEKRLADEVAQAARYVQSLLPAPMTDGPVRIESKFVPSTQLAGDAFGYRWLDADRLAIYLLDVSGHGVGAALLAVSVLNIISHQTLRRTDFADPAAVMKGLNDIFEMTKHGGKFFTIWYGVYTPADRKLTFSGGGHPPPLLMKQDHRPGDKPTELHTMGPPIGVIDDIPFENDTIEIPTGARMLLYSDGAVEISLADGTVATQEAFNDSFAALRVDDVLTDAVLERARKLHGPGVLDDDCSLVQVSF